MAPFALTLDPTLVDEDVLAVVRARQAKGESIPTIARHLKIGRSTLYRALQPSEGSAPPPAVGVS